MNTIYEVIGVIACGSMVVRYSYRAVVSPRFTSLLNEGIKAMSAQTNEQTLLNCVSWNIRERDGYRIAANHAANSAQRTEAVRRMRRYQRNIDQLNDQLRQLERSN